MGKACDVTNAAHPEGVGYQPGMTGDAGADAIGPGTRRGARQARSGGARGWLPAQPKNGMTARGTSAGMTASTATSGKPA